MREERDRVLHRLVADGERYRAELNRMHARLVRLYPEDGRLRRAVEGIDRRLAGNLETLERYLGSVARDRLRVDARGGAP